MSLTFTNLQNTSQANLQQLLNILQSNEDLNSCLIDCSNQGVCQQVNQTFVCQCNQNYMGSSCQTYTGACSRNKCLNNATCVNTLNMTSYKCECPSNGLFYGQYCENRINTCQNVTCSLHGFCISNQNLTTQCKCFYGYSGEICDVESTSIKIVKVVQWTTTIICIICIVIFWMITIGSDILSYFGIGDKLIDIEKWKHDKLHSNQIEDEKRKKNRFKDRKIHTMIYISKK